MEAETLMGSVSLVAGVAFFLWLRKRKFDRMNAAGIQQYSSFGRKLVATAMDYVLAMLSIGFLLVGVLGLAVQFQDTWGWVVLLPVYLAGLFVLLFAAT